MTNILWPAASDYAVTKYARSLPRALTNGSASACSRHASGQSAIHGVSWCRTFSNVFCSGSACLRGDYLLLVVIEAVKIYDERPNQSESEPSGRKAT